MDWKKYFAIGSALIIWPIVIWSVLHGANAAFTTTLGIVSEGISLMLIGAIDQFQVKTMDFYFYITRYDQNDPLLVLIVSKKQWDAEGYMDGEFSEEEYKTLNPIMKKLNLHEISEATFESAGKLSASTLRAKLLELGLKESESFTKVNKDEENYLDEAAKKICENTGQIWNKITLENKGLNG